MAKSGSFPNKIAEARKAKGWSQATLAAHIGVSQQAVQRYEAGQRDIRASILVKLSRALDVTVAYLLCLTDVEAPAPTLVEVPLYGAIAAGSPIDMESADEVYPVPAALLRRWPQSFLLRIEGESMNRILPNGSYALVDPCADVEYDGQPYAVCINDRAATVKRVHRSGTGLELIPDSTDASFAPQVFGLNSAEVGTISIIGRVVWHCVPYDWDY